VLKHEMKQRLSSLQFSTVRFLKLSPCFGNVVVGSRNVFFMDSIKPNLSTCVWLSGDGDVGVLSGAVVSGGVASTRRCVTFGRAQGSKCAIITVELFV
jgi:hypothetical protein